ncbi:hypothetical protein CR513_47828, partial [Mucuna pruriens]
MNSGRGSTSFVPHVHITRSASSCWFNISMKWRSTDGQDANSNTTSNLKHGQQHILNELTSLVRQLAIGQHQLIAAIKACGTVEHPTNMSSANVLYDFDPEIELTLSRIRKVRNVVVSTNSNFNTSSTFENSVSATNATNSSDFSATNSFSSLNNSQQQELMENQDRMLKELATPDVSGLIHLLPKFHGLASEDLYKHLKEFHVVCSTIRPQGIPKDYIKKKAFPFSLDEAAKDWFSSRPPRRSLSEKKSVKSSSIQEKHCTNTGNGSIACVQPVHIIRLVSNY